MPENASDATGTPRLLLVMSGATAVGLLLIIGFLNVAEWWLVPVTVAAVIVSTALVLAAFLQTLAEESDDEAEPEPAAPVTADAPAPAVVHGPRRRSGYTPAPARRPRTRT